MCKRVAIDTARGSLAGKARIMAVIEKNTASQRQLLRWAVAAVLKIEVRLFIAVIGELLFAKFESIDRVHDTPPLGPA